MKKILLSYICCLLLSCSADSGVSNVSSSTLMTGGQLSALSFLYQSDIHEGYPKVFYRSTMDFSAERLLSSKREPLSNYIAYGSDTLNNFQQKLSKSVAISDSSIIPYFDTEFVVILEFESTKKDTISFSWDRNRPFLFKDSLWYQPELIELILSILNSKTSDFQSFLNRHFKEGKYKYCSNPIWIYDDNTPSPPDYGCFRGTALEVLALALSKEDSCMVKQLLQDHPQWVNLDKTYQRGTDDYIDIDSVSKSIVCNNTLMTSCVLFQQPEMLKLLINYGFDIEYQDAFRCNQTALMTACENSYFFECGKILVENGANIDTRIENNRYATPLQICVESRNIKMASYLLDLGANLNLENNNYCTAFDLAMQQNYLKMAYLLLLKGYNRYFFVGKRGECISLFKYLETFNPELKEDAYYRNKILDYLQYKQTTAEK